MCALTTKYRTGREPRPLPRRQISVWEAWVSHLAVYGRTYGWADGWAGGLDRRQTSFMGSMSTTLGGGRASARRADGGRKDGTAAKIPYGKHEYRTWRRTGGRAVGWTGKRADGRTRPSQTINPNVTDAKYPYRGGGLKACACGIGQNAIPSSWILLRIGSNSSQDPNLAWFQWKAPHNWPSSLLSALCVVNRDFVPRGPRVPFYLFLVRQRDFFLREFWRKFSILNWVK